jgi:hypothetical protein
MAARCGHWDVVDEQCQKLGDFPDTTAFPQRQIYLELREKARRKMREQSDKAP